MGLRGKLCVCVCNNRYLSVLAVLHYPHLHSKGREIPNAKLTMEASSSSNGAKARIAAELQALKRKSGKTYGQIAEETGLTNVYVAQLLRRLAQLKPGTAALLRASLPALTDDVLHEMMQPPLRSYDPNLIQEPSVYRLQEAVMHFGESIKEIINEEFGDGIMSAIDFYCSVDKVKGMDGKDRVVVTFDVKYLPYTEQATEHAVSRIRKQEHQDGKPKLS